MHHHKKYTPPPYKPKDIAPTDKTSKVSTGSSNSNRPDAFMNKPDKPGYLEREAKGLCTACGMSNHKRISCRTYPKEATPQENFQKWLSIKQARSAASIGNKINNVNDNKEDDDNSAEGNKTGIDMYTAHLREAKACRLLYIPFEVRQT